MKSKILGTLGVLCLAVCIAPTGYAQSVKLYLGGTSPADAAWRSAVLPGWGQLYTDRPAKGYTIMAVTGGALLSSALLYAKAKDVYDEYERSGLQDDSRYSSYEDYYTYSVSAAIVAGLAWIYGITEAYVYTYHNPIALRVIPNGVEVSCCVRFGGKRGGGNG